MVNIEENQAFKWKNIVKNHYFKKKIFYGKISANKKDNCKNA